MKILVWLAYPYVAIRPSQLSSIHFPLRNHHLIVSLHFISASTHMRRRNLADISQHRQHSWRLVYIIVACTIKAESSDATASRLQGIKLGVIAAVDAHDHEPSAATGSSIVPNQDIAWDLIASSKIHHVVLICFYPVRQHKRSVVVAAIRTQPTSRVPLGFCLSLSRCVATPSAFVCLSFRAQACFILLFRQLAHFLLRNLGDWIFAGRD